MKKLLLILRIMIIICMALTGCKNTNQTSRNSSESESTIPVKNSNSYSANEIKKIINSCDNLNELRKKFNTNITNKKQNGEIVPVPPEQDFFIQQSGEEKL